MIWYHIISYDMMIWDNILYEGWVDTSCDATTSKACSACRCDSGTRQSHSSSPWRATELHCTLPPRIQKWGLLFQRSVYVVIPMERIVRKRWFQSWWDRWLQTTIQDWLESFPEENYSTLSGIIFCKKRSHDEWDHFFATSASTLIRTGIMFPRGVGSFVAKIMPCWMEWSFAKIDSTWGGTFFVKNDFTPSGSIFCKKWLGSFFTLRQWEWKR